MIELTTTRHNEMIDPGLHIWAWQIPVYLFLGGLVAGLMIIAGYRLLRARAGESPSDSCCVHAPFLGLVLLSAGMFALFLDLEHKLYVWRLYTTFQIASPMSWGAWILILVYPALLACGLVHLPEIMPGVVYRFPALRRGSEWIRQRQVLVNNIGLVNMVLGVMLGIYTGILLSAMGARPLWNSSLLGPLFLFSGLSTGAAVLHVLSSLGAQGRGQSEFSDAIVSALSRMWRPKGSAESAATLARADNSFLTVELFILLLYLLGMATSTGVQQEAARLLLTGPFAAAFWVFVIGMGILLPLVLQFLQVQHKIRHLPLHLPALLVVFGGLVLRFIIVYAGQYSHWN